MKRFRGEEGPPRASDTNTALSETEMIRRLQQQLHQVEAEKRQLEAETRQLEAETRQLEAETRQLEAETRQLAAEKMQAESKANQVEAETRQLEAETRQLKAENTVLTNRLFYTGTSVDLYNEFAEGAVKADTLALFPLPSSHESRLHSLYNECLKMVVPNNLTSETSVQTYINNIMQAIVNFLSGPTSLKYHDTHQTYMNDPHLAPDCTFTHQTIAKASWSNTVIVGDLKAVSIDSSKQQVGGGNSKDGLGQALKYGKAVLTHQIERFKLPVFFSDVRTIQFAIYDKENKISDLLQFIDGEDVTIGFKALCGILASEFDNLGYEHHSSIVLDGITFSISDILGSGGNSFVYAVNCDSKPAALKVPRLTSQTSQLIQQERSNIAIARKELSEKNLSTSFLPEVVDHPTLRSGLLLATIGQPLKAYYQSKVYANDLYLSPDERLPIFRKIAMDMLNALHNLKLIGYFHGDVRPANWIENNGTLILLDWEGFGREGTTNTHLTTLFASERLLMSQSEWHPYTMADDLEAWCYSLFDLDDPHMLVPWAIPRGRPEKTSTRYASLVQDRADARKAYIDSAGSIGAMIGRLWNVLVEHRYCSKECFDALRSALELDHMNIVK
ncbi:hypothetical protein HDV05_001337 [Chytridiales sp. JEL 0842]|nr:hypothetical protein HDV05_001337 [Chytridiales sp. JEL 0842]